MDVVGVAGTELSNIVLLGNAGDRVIPIFVGGTEALSIQLRFDGREYQRPLTHDLLDSVMATLDGKIIKVQVDKLEDDIFFGSVFIQRDGELLKIDSRPSDAIALALGSGAAIFVVTPWHCSSAARKSRLDGRARRWDAGPVRSGEVISERFEIIRPADEGGMGVVYYGIDRQTDEPVAVKVLHARGSESSARFAREAEVLERLNHPSIVRHVAHGQTPDGNLFLAMEWLEGVDLGRKLRKEGLTISESLTLAQVTASALAAAHAEGVVHRDVKPSNLLLVDGEVGKVKLLDFGVARVSQATMTLSGITFGTPGYMAPEQARGDRMLDARADVFALGCVLFECLTGRAAFQGEHLMAVLAKILLEEAPRVRELRSDVPRALDQLVARMLSKAPARRPRDGHELATEIASLDQSAVSPLSSSVAPEPSITPGEQRLLCVVLAGASPDQMVDTMRIESMPTVAAIPVPAPTPSPTPAQTLRSERVLTPDSGITESNAARVSPVIRVEPNKQRPGSPPADDGAPSRPEAVVGVLHKRIDARAGLSAEAQERLREAVAICDAHVESLADGSVIATLTGSQSATDQVASAARCALAMRIHLPGAPVVVTTGRGVLSGQLPVGDAIDRAAQLMRDLLFGEEGGEDRIVIDDVTATLLDTRFEVVQENAQLVLKRERDMPEARRTLLGKRTPLVGRDRELLTLEAIYAECLEESVSRAVVVTAPAGAGKSRLSYEFVRKVSERDNAPEVWVGRGDPLSAGSPFALVARALRQSTGMVEGEPLEARRRRLRTRVARHVPEGARQRVSEFLGELVGVPFPDDDSVQLRAARQDAMLMGDQIRRAWEDFLAAECEAHPVLLVLEDLHWGDLPSVKLVDAALRHLKELPFMVLTLARPEVQELFPRLWADRAAVEIGLGELSRRSSEKLIRHVLGDDVSQEKLRDIVQRAAGNAFYLEEILRAIVEGRGDGLPETVLAMVQSRLEALSAQGRWALRAASVFGQVFWRGGVHMLMGGEAGGVDLAACLTELVDREIIVRRSSTRFVGEDEMLFQHAIIREAAYAMLTDEDRLLGHHLAAQWLQQAGETDGMVLAEHYERASQPERAGVWFRQAAEHALEGNDFKSAISRAERGIESDSTMDGMHELETVGYLRLLQAEAHRWRGEQALAFERAELALSLLPRRSARWFLAVGELALAAGRVGRSDALLEKANDFGSVPSGADRRPYVVGAARTIVTLLYAHHREAAAILIRELDGLPKDFVEREPVVAAVIHRVRATGAAAKGDSSMYLAESEAATASYELAGDLRTALSTRVSGGHALLTLGMYDKALTALTEALATAERLGLPSIVAVARHNLGLALARTGHMQEGLEAERTAADEFRAQKDRRLEAASKLYIGLISPEQAGNAASEAVELAGDNQGLRAHALAVQASVALFHADLPAARQAAGEAASILERLGSMEEGGTLIRLVHARVCHQDGDLERAKSVISAACEKLQTRARDISDPDARRSFLENVPEHRDTLELAERWGA